MAEPHRPFEDFYACVDAEGRPLGYVRSPDDDAALKAAEVKWPGVGVRVEHYDGIL